MAVYSPPHPPCTSIWFQPTLSWWRRKNFSQVKHNAGFCRSLVGKFTGQWNEYCWFCEAGYSWERRKCAQQVAGWEELYEVLVLVQFCLLALVERFFLSFMHFSPFWTRLSKLKKPFGKCNKWCSFGVE